MREVIQLAAPIDTGTRRIERANPAIRTDAVYVVFTTIDRTRHAVRVASVLAKSMAVPLTLIHFRPLSDQRAVDRRMAVSSFETDAFVEHVRAAGIDARVRVYLSRNDRHAFAMAFKRRSFIVIGGTRRWFGSCERLRRQLERAGHFVLLVDERQHQEPHTVMTTVAGGQCRHLRQSG